MSSNLERYPSESDSSSQKPFNPEPIYINVPSGHTPTWSEILPHDFFGANCSVDHSAPATPKKRKLVMSLINAWEFSLDVEPFIDSRSENEDRALARLRTQIIKIAKNHMGQGGRKGAIFKRGLSEKWILPDDPLLKLAFSNKSSDESVVGKGGKWLVPLGAYQALLTYLTSDQENDVIPIPPEQLHAVLLSRERLKKNFPTVSELLRRGVNPRVAEALAPYQRGGVDFILDREGRALLADEMGLGKTVQAVAAMSAYWLEWPLLVLCPSSARYHWEMELMHWLGRLESSTTSGSDEGGLSKVGGLELTREAINVISSGNCVVLRTDGATKVVVCSYGLIMSLVKSNKIFDGMFNAIIVDESHLLKNKDSKRTETILPLLKGANRCLLLSGTPALARPSELWPQLSVLGGRHKDGLEDKTSGVWIDEEGFYSKYVNCEAFEENGFYARLAELHTLLTSTVMLRRTKADILKNLQPKIREKVFIDIKDPKLQHEFKIYIQMLRQGRGIMGKLARQHSKEEESAVDSIPQINPSDNGEQIGSRFALHHLYKITGQSKVSKVTYMLKRWLADPSLGKLCIFAHHLDVLDEIGRGAGLSNHIESTTKFIRIDGATLPKARQEQIVSFQTNPTVRVALLGITAAGVAVTLTASSTVWFAELFWTPAIMIQAEDRCHRIGQKAKVRCLYFIARGTLDEIMWKLIEKKFRELGEFVEGRENMDIALERELEEDNDAEIIKVGSCSDVKKRKANDDISDLIDLVYDGIKEEIDEIVHEEEDALVVEIEVEDDDLNSEDNGWKKCQVPNQEVPIQQPSAQSSKQSAICVSVQDEKEDKILTIKDLRNLHSSSEILRSVNFGHSICFNNVVLYQMQFRGERYGFNVMHFKGRVIIKDPFDTGTKSGAIIVAVGRRVLHQEPFDHIRLMMKNELSNNSPATLIFAEDLEFIALVKEVIIPHIRYNTFQVVTQVTQTSPVIPLKSETIDLLDEDD